MSITLSNELVMNVYIPVKNTQRFTFNGVLCEASGFKGDIITLDDGNEYYLLNVSLGSSEAAKELKLTAEVKAGDSIASVTFTFSIPRYAAKVLDDTASTDVEKALAKDVLAYIKAAYEYFGTAHNSEAEIRRVGNVIDSIIGEDYASSPVSKGTTVFDSRVKSVTLNLDAKPTIRFFVTDMSIEFYVGTKKLKTVKNESEGYVELDVYAYALCQTITYGDGGSYHISDFVTKSNGTSYEALVKCFVRYTESAAAYRSEYLSQSS